nr:transglycosylase SLT domain-containing protein [uncultured Desulfobacter sp.]
MQKEQDEADQLRVDDALNKAKEESLRLQFGDGTDDGEKGFSNQKGIKALERPEDKPLADEYAEKLQKKIDELSDGLGNDQQRELFKRFANDIKTSLYGKALGHEAEESKNYALSVSEGIQSTAMQDIAKNWNSPGDIDAAVRRIQAETYRQAKLLGKSAEWQQATARNLTSGAHKLAAMTALENNDPVYAKAYLNKYSKQMNADDLAGVQKVLTKEIDIRAATQAANDILQSKPMQVGDASRAFNILIDAESGGRQLDKKGKPLTSSKGAIGIAQVMPETAKEAAKLAGLPWDEDKYKTNEAYNKALGMAYFQKQWQNFGDLAKAYAAYNAGPGALQKAVTQANKEGKHWLSYLPEETRNYVTKNMAAFDGGKGGVDRPTLEELDKALLNDPRIANNPERLKMARTELQRQYKMRTDAIKRQEEDSYHKALDMLFQNGGNFAGLPVDVRSKIPAEKRLKLISDAANIAKGQPIKNDSMVWAQIMSMPQEELAAMTPKAFHNEFRALLDDSHLEKGYSMIAAAKSAAEKAENAEPKHLEILSTAQRVKQAAQKNGILPYKKAPNKTEATNFCRFQDTIDQRLRAFEATQLQGKRKANSDELQKIIDEVIMDKVSLSKDWWLDPKGKVMGALSEDDKKAAYVLVGEKEVYLSSIPDKWRNLIIDALKKKNLPVTEQEIAELWVEKGEPK